MYHLEWGKLDKDQRQILTLIAMLPPPVFFDDLFNLTGISPAKILKSLEEFDEKGIVSVYEPLGSGYYQLKDPGLINAVLDALSEKKRKSEAEKLISFYTSWLEEGDKKDLLIAHICQLSGIKPKSFKHILKSAEYCAARGLRDDAASYFRLVLDKYKETCSEDKKIYIDSTLGLLKVHGHLIPHEHQKELLERALGFAEEHQDKDRLAKLKLTYAQILKTTGHYERAAQYFDEGWAIAQQLGEAELLKEAALSTTDFLFWQGRVSDAVQRYEQVIGNLEEFPSDQTTMRACAALGWCYGICGQTARGIGLIEAVRMKAEELSLKEVKVYADLMTVLTLLEARRISEAKGYLQQILSLPEELVGHYILWAANAAMAYVRFHEENFKACFELQKNAFQHSKKIGWPHHRGPWNFEYIDALEENGMVLPGMTYESELQRIFNWPDIYMKGVAFRYKALRSLKKDSPRDEIYEELEQSSKFLEESGAKLELSRTQILTARLLLDDGHAKKAQKILLEAWEVISNVDEALFPDDLKQFIIEENEEESLIRTIVEVGNSLGTIRSQKKLLERMINLTMRFTSAERGGFFLSDEKSYLTLAASRNLDRTMVNSRWFTSNYQVVREVARSGKGFIGSGLTDLTNENSGSSNAKPRGFKVCTPVMLQEKVLGVLYLDGHLNIKRLGDKDLPLLTAIGNQVGIALDNVRAYEEIAELKDRLKEETRLYRMEIEPSQILDQMVGCSETIHMVKNQIHQVASTDSTVLISGETGVGKELAARAIHSMSNRSDGPFISVNVASLSENLIESELFGHEKGAFTGASQIRRGRFELAHGGTLFLDDLENLSVDAQVKLLRVIQEREFERVGGNETIKSDFRLLAATNQNLEEMKKRGVFRSDLFYRVNVFPIHIPPLRQRKDDIPLLANHFLNIYKTKMGKQINGISHNDIKQLKHYPWPGNVRELQHVIERAVILTSSKVLTVPNLQEKEKATTRKTSTEFLPLKEMEKAYIIEALEKCNWVVSGKWGAAKLLGLKPTTLYSKMKRLGIRKEVKYSAP